MTELTLFKGGVPAYMKDFKDTTTDALAGGGDIEGMRRISTKGCAFRDMVGNKEISVSDSRAMNIIIIKAAPTLYRSYYEDSYVEGENKGPTCWSTDTQTPAAEAEGKQAKRCADCKQNIKGSGQGESRACRFHQRIAVLVENGDGLVRQMIVPATSIFGEGEKGKLPLQAYARHLKTHNTPIPTVVTEVRFDTASATPKLFFKPVRPVTEEEFAQVQTWMNSAEAENAVKFTVNPSPAKTNAALFDAPDEPVVVEEKVPEPKKAAPKKTGPADTTPSSLADLVGDWDD